MSISKLKLRDLWPFVLFPGLKLLVHLFTIPGYGIFRDELYYLACTGRLGWGYVDQPPLSIFVLWLVRSVLGESLWAIRLVPALAGAATVFLVGWIARQLGGGRLAQALAMAAAIAAPIYLALDHFYSMNALDMLFWAAAASVLLRLREDDGLRTWLLLGVVLGLGLNNKISVLWLGFGLAAGLLLTEERRSLKTPGPWAAAGVAFLLFLPHLTWQAVNGFPTLEFIANATGRKMVEVSPLQFVGGQVDMLRFGVTGLALLGLVALLVFPAGRFFRFLGWIYVAVFLLLMLNGSSRSEYLAPAYTWLLAAGGLGFERLVGRIPRPSWRLVAGVLAFGWLVAEGAVVAPFALPILPVESYVAYARKMGVAPSTAERKELAELPQFYADMHGWEEKVAAARRVVANLPEEDRAKACLFTLSYGVAGALEFLGRGELPPVVSGHNSYWLWGPGGCTGEVVVIMGGDAQDHAEHFASVEQVDTVECGYCMPYENHQPIFVARDFQGDLAEAWPGLKHFG